ncbi:conjugative transfer pilus assembly protein TraH [Azospirillum sp. OGB3]|uniref:conjugal transfer protein TraH n=1 Tax=Azospirillum sp. OGB3 TaxID=2587012 RepID=UPI0016061143|nr:conjugal transfer protein TraH [Azospirillum sp. OGB3]MBB3267644.1 conjugative transfer pilus assembly protein TraH [Azospirillum sp. OGB3]
MTKTARKIVAAATVSACLTVAAAPIHVQAAGLQSQIDSLFGSMSNTTPPGVWETQRRGVFAGGQFTAKNRIMNENLISFVPPSFEAGCGGIDLFGGSFSFINADQFVQLMRGIAANAAGYAFQLALGSMCPECASIIEQIQKKIQELNQFFGNSCQLAQGIVNDTLGAALKKQETEASKISFSKGIGDIFQSWTNTGGSGPVQDVANNTPNEFETKVKGNLVWRALKKHAVSGWFTGGDEDMLEAMMNITGTVVVGDMEDAGDGKKAPRYTAITGNKIRFRDLVNGTNGQPIPVLRCDNKGANGCTNPTMGTIVIKGFRKLLEEKLLDGSGGTPGLIHRIASNQGRLSEADRAFFSPQPYNLAPMIFQLAKNGRHGAVALTQRAIPHLAHDLATLMVDDMSKAVDTAVKVTDDAHAKALSALLQESRKDLREQQQQVSQQIGSPTDLYRDYLVLLDIAEKVRYAATGAVARE